MSYRDEPWFAEVKRIFDAYGVPQWVWEAIMVAESGGNPRARNTRGEDSVGLFQLNRRGGQGTGYSAEELMDPVTNARLAAPAIAAAWNAVKDAVARGMLPPDRAAAEVAVRSGHPGGRPDSPCMSPVCRSAYERIRNIAAGLVGRSPEPSPVPTPTPGGHAFPAPGGGGGGTAPAVGIPSPIPGMPAIELPPDFFLNAGGFVVGAIMVAVGLAVVLFQARGKAVEAVVGG
jgi:hypothetical protein